MGRNSSKTEVVNEYGFDETLLMPEQDLQAGTEQDLQANAEQEAQTKVPEVLFEQTVKMDVNRVVIIQPVNMASVINVKNIGIAGDLYASQLLPSFKEENRIRIGESKDFEGGNVYLKSASRPVAYVTHVR